jgi:hypothetical protein
MLRELETGDVWEIIEARAHLIVIKRERDGLLRTILDDTPAYAPA